MIWTMSENVICGWMTNAKYLLYVNNFGLQIPGKRDCNVYFL